MKYRVLIADSRYSDYREEEDVLQSIDAEIIFERSDQEDMVAKKCSDVDGLIVNLAPITRHVIESMKKCKCVSRYGVGYDNIDVKALKERGIFLANVPDYCQEDVSDHAFALLIDCIRRISKRDKYIRNGLWDVCANEEVVRLCGKTFGFIGFGKITQCLRRKITGFYPAKVLVYDPFFTESEVSKYGAQKVSLEELCKQSDFISIHTPLNNTTRGMIGADQFGRMKKTAILINTSRGGVVDERNLIKALKEKMIAFAGLDVFEQEPLPIKSELRNLDNIVLTDHAGWYSRESMTELKRKAALNISETLIKGIPLYPVKL